MPALNIPTLVDCGCQTTVWGDHSGVEIDYCPLHEAAGDLLTVCQEALMDYESQLPHTTGMTLRRVTAISERLRTAIAKATETENINE